MEKQDILKQCRVEGNIVKLPGIQLDRKLYMQVAQALELIGGKWKGHKVQGFVFPDDPTELLQEIANGEKRNLKKEHQAFYTPTGIAELMVNMAGLREEHSIMEPSAGSGAILEVIFRYYPKSTVFVCETMKTAVMTLEKKFGDNPRFFFLNPEDDGDFLKLPDRPVFDRIIANPPFGKNQDIEHIYKMYSMLAPGGMIVTLASTHWMISSNRKEKQFAEWLSEVNGSATEMGPGVFKESGTNIPIVLIRIEKPN